MKLYNSLENLLLPKAACAIGMFDGIHIGHQMVLENALRKATILSMPSVVLTFLNHPQGLLTKTPTQLLSSIDDRVQAFRSMGFDIVVMLPFDNWLKNLSADAFVSQILQWHLGAKSISVGYDHCFGKNRTGDGKFLVQAGQSYGFSVDIIDPVKVLTLPGSQGYGQIVSSTLIRKLLAFGDITLSNQLLGKHYTLSGPVIHGFSRGRQMGFPTANLSPDPERLVPGVATYGGYATLNQKVYRAVCNIGRCPTFNDAYNQPRIEVHLLDYTGSDFYEADLSFTFRFKIRDEKKFESVEHLKRQILLDCNFTEQELKDLENNQRKTARHSS
ncbi:MAG: riboflavin biosynthesis protein RibF [Cyanobacteria bacterium P01_H01_bin.74]